MNEITHIHLGRQPFTISVEAHHALKAYLAAIKKQAGDKSGEVVKEVELRMAELLSERGITSKKTILTEDIDFLKEHLGAPKDFKEDADNQEPSETKEPAQKRLFRDTENAMVAGVAAGFANFFGIDVLIIRLLFVVTVLAGGWGILLYILLWLLVPEAKTSSDQLQMRGMAVTVDNLKEAVEHADVKGAAKRANGAVVSFINSFFKVVLKIIGVSFIFTGLCLLFSGIATVVYMILHDGKLFQENLFPVGSSEVLLLYVGLGLTALVSVFAILSGMAMFKRKWPIKFWITGILIGLFFVGSAVGVGLTADTVPRVRDRYQAATSSTVRKLKPFTEVNVIGGGIRSVEYQYADTYYVKMDYFDNPDVSKITTEVVNGRLEINSDEFVDSRNCNMLCLFPNYNVVITVYSPNQFEKPAFEGEPAESYYLPNKVEIESE